MVAARHRAARPAQPPLHRAAAGDRRDQPAHAHRHAPPAEFLAAQLRRGNAGSNTAADHITVLDAALAQLPDSHRHGTPVLVRADTAGCTREFLAHIRGFRKQAVSCEFSIGWSIKDKERSAISAIPKTVWADAIDADGGHRDGAGLGRDHRCSTRSGAGYPAGTRVVVRRERPHPGALLDAFAERDGWRYTEFGDQLTIAARVAAEHPEVAAAERVAYRAVLLDEYQDTGHAQRVLLRSLYGTPPGEPVWPDAPTVTAVGDPEPVDLRLARRHEVARTTRVR